MKERSYLCYQSSFWSSWHGSLPIYFLVLPCLKKTGEGVYLFLVKDVFSEIDKYTFSIVISCRFMNKNCSCKKGKFSVKFVFIVSSPVSGVVHSN